jgi:hypothetical protein
MTAGTSTSSVRVPDAIAAAVAAGMLRPEDLQGPDPIGEEEYAAAQRWR